MIKNNTKSRSKRPQCDAHTPLPLSKHPQSGRSMIEMLGVLAIIGVLSVGGIMGYSKAMMRYKINKTIEQIAYIAGNIRTTFANQGNYEGVWNPNIQKKAHIVPDDMWKEGEDNPQHAWEDYVTIESAAKNSADTNNNKAFYIRYDNIPTEACIELITQDWKNAQVKVIGNDSMGVGFVYFIPPAGIDEAVQICNNGSAEMDFYFDIDEKDSYWQGRLDECSVANAGNC